MAINYAKIFNRRSTPQSQPIPGSNQVRNSGGGYSWEMDDWTRFDRFLILGAEGGTYYITERDLVNQNHEALLRCINADGVRAVNRMVEISDAGRAPKNDPAIFALALVVTHGGFTLTDPNDRGMLDVVGFDTSVPAVIANFVRD